MVGRGQFLVAAPGLFFGISVVARGPFEVFFGSRRRAFATRDLTPRTRNDARGCIEFERGSFPLARKRGLSTPLCGKAFVTGPASLATGGP